MNSYIQTWSFDSPGTKENIHNIFTNFGVPTCMVEIGVYEGRTTCYISDTYSYVVPKFEIYCIDPHNYSDDLLNANISEVKERFIHNISECENKNIHYINKTSSDGLIDLINKKVEPQFIYVDGDHKGSTVLEDLVLSFRLLPIGGVILCDDVIWKHPENSNIPDSPSMNPRMAVENFIQCNWHRLKVINLPHGHQTAFVKTGK